MNVCYLCNGLETKQAVCSSCQCELNDLGKVADFYDDYSPYMGIDLNKLEDGDPTSTKRPECKHLFACSLCEREYEIIVSYGKNIT